MKLLQLILLGSALLLSNAFAPPSRQVAPTFARAHLDTRRHNFFENIGSFIENFGRKVTASHILIGPKSGMNEEEAKAKLIEIKEECADDPVMFAEFAAEFSTCPSAKKGGSLGEFGAGMMVKPFDDVCWKAPVGVVQGPISTMFGEHLILVTDRPEKK
eukprot:scaffold6592_cov53-Attheya_sp.AAC.5